MDAIHVVLAFVVRTRPVFACQTTVQASVGNDMSTLVLDSQTLHNSIDSSISTNWKFYVALWIHHLRKLLGTEFKLLVFWTL